MPTGDAVGVAQNAHRASRLGRLQRLDELDKQWTTLVAPREFNVSSAIDASNVRTGLFSSQKFSASSSLNLKSERSQELSEQMRFVQRQIIEIENSLSPGLKELREKMSGEYKTLMGHKSADEAFAASIRDSRFGGLGPEWGVRAYLRSMSDEIGYIEDVIKTATEPHQFQHAGTFIEGVDLVKGVDYTSSKFLGVPKWTANGKANAIQKLRNRASDLQKSIDDHKTREDAIARVESEIGKLAKQEEDLAVALRSADFVGAN